MTGWPARIDSLLGELGRNVTAATRAVRSLLGDDPVEVLAYRGYGDASRAHVYGRVLEKPGVGASTDADSTLRNLLNTWRRAESDPIAFARVRVEYAGTAHEIRADDEGFFGGWIVPDIPVVTDAEWTRYEATVVSSLPVGIEAAKGAGEILLPGPTARFGVISDIDDTVIQSRVSNFLQAARTVMLGNARTRLPFPGVAAFYQALRNGASGNERNPVFYVSSSPWNIYDVITEFMDLQEVPRGPLLLRDWDISLGSLASERHYEHKGAAIRDILQLYANMPFMLIGDTSQHDPEIYKDIVSEFPDRIRAIYIRDVTGTATRQSAVKELARQVLAAGSVLVLAEDTLGAARHAAEQGWIDANALPDVQKEKRADEGRDGTKAPAPDGGEPTSGSAPTVIGAAGTA
ncbi:MAG TPA: phosphatase domain-containing protein [Gemmatimonadaceae bacterium]|nr:phosphatase domain-containing protein [Gemmatimonadaceae bacterium]